MNKKHFESIANIINDIYNDDKLMDKYTILKEIVSRLVISFTKSNVEFSPNKFINKCFKQ